MKLSAAALLSFNVFSLVQLIGGSLPGQKVFYSNLQYTVVHSMVIDADYAYITGFAK